MKITPLGDSALLVHVHSKLSSNSEKCLREVAAVFRRLQAANLPGVIEVAPAFTTVGVFYEAAQVVAAGAPLGEISKWLAAKIEKVIEGRGIQRAKAAPPRLVEIPVCYEGAFAPDLALVASHAKMKETDVVSIHAKANYQVACLGFAPGFPYLSGLPDALATPRRKTPRTQVKPGSVAIGGSQTGIYPGKSPGGWNVIGRTPLRLFDCGREQPSLLAMGDAVRFRRIAMAEFEALAK